MYWYFKEEIFYFSWNLYCLSILERHWGVVMTASCGTKAKVRDFVLKRRYFINLTNRWIVHFLFLAHGTYCRVKSPRALQCLFALMFWGFNVFSISSVNNVLISLTDFILIFFMLSADDAIYEYKELLSRTYFLVLFELMQIVFCCVLISCSCICWFRV